MPAQKAVPAGTCQLGCATVLSLLVLGSDTARAAGASTAAAFVSAGGQGGAVPCCFGSLIILQLGECTGRVAALLNRLLCVHGQFVVGSELCLGSG